MLPLYRDAVGRLGAEVTFKEERIFGQDEIDEICSSFRPYIHTYNHITYISI